MKKKKPARTISLAARRLTACLAAGDRNAIREVAGVLRKTKGDVRAAAELLGVGRATLNRWLVDYPELDEETERARAGRDLAGKGKRK